MYADVNLSFFDVSSSASVHLVSPDDGVYNSI